MCHICVLIYFIVCLTTAEVKVNTWRKKNAFKPHPIDFGCCPFLGGGSVVSDSLIIVAHIVYVFVLR